MASRIEGEVVAKTMKRVVFCERGTGLLSRQSTFLFFYARTAQTEAGF
jgi:hypothetical protein